MAKSIVPTKIKSVKEKVDLVKNTTIRPARLAQKAPVSPVVKPNIVVEKPATKKSLWQAVAWGRIFVGLVVVVILIGGAVWLFGGRGLVADNIKDGQLSAEQQVLILNKISKHIKLPSTAYQIAIATDPGKLKTLSPFYDQVKAGDVVLVYENFALIYDERGDVLVNATMLNQQ